MDINETGASGESRKARSASKRASQQMGDGEMNGPDMANLVASTRGRTDGRTPDLRKDLRDFASGRPQGWEHDDWLNFLEALQGRGHDIKDREAIGTALEKERLDLALTAVKGIGPQKRAALIERFGNVWTLRRAEADEIAKVGGLTPALIERIKAEIG
jgi:hypothetical protein